MAGGINSINSVIYLGVRAGATFAVGSSRIRPRVDPASQYESNASRGTDVVHALKNKYFAVGTIIYLAFAYPTLVLADNIRIVKYDKEQVRQDLNRKFIEPNSLGQTIVSKLKEIAVTTTQRQSGNNTAIRDLASRTPGLSKSAWAKQMALLSYDPDNSARRNDDSALMQTLVMQSRKAAEVNLKKSFPIFERFKNGLTFNLSTKIILTKPIHNIRYGLIERDILPADNSIPLAGFGSINDIDRAYATPAQVIYTIDRLDAAASPRVFSNSSDTTLAEPTVRWGRLPSSKLTIKIDSPNNDDSIGDQISNGAIPGARVTVSQFEGLISCQMIVGSTSIDKTLRTEVSTPVIMNTTLSQKFDDKFKLTDIVAKSTFSGPIPSQLNLAYSQSTQGVRGEWQINQGRTGYSVQAESSKLIKNTITGSASSPIDRLSIALQRSF
jgi:hypothetical protein